jgi:hypothetical protein
MNGGIMAAKGWTPPQIPTFTDADLLRVYSETALQNAMVRMGGYGSFGTDAQRSALLGA